MTAENDRPPDILTVEDLLARLVVNECRLKAVVRIHPMVTTALLHEHVLVAGEEQVINTRVLRELVRQASECRYLEGRAKSEIVSATELVISNRGIKYLTSCQIMAAAK